MRRVVLIVIATLVAVPGIPALVIWLFGPTVGLPKFDETVNLAVADAYFKSLVAQGYPPGFVV
ncbi:MAG: hypothetical protein O3A63_13045 [Proteobacteria bacterium]|nr:hypothetical protein [Pseudomonadota bacterium]